MRRLAIIVPIVLLASDASAISRYQTNTMSCASVQAALQRDGVAILRYPSPNNPSLPLYDRYVSDRRFCAANQRADLRSVPAADTSQCRVRKCVQASGSSNKRTP